MFKSSIYYLHKFIFSANKLLRLGDTWVNKRLMIDYISFITQINLFMKPEEQLHPHNSLKLIGKNLGGSLKSSGNWTVSCCFKISELKIREIFNLFKRETGEINYGSGSTILPKAIQ